MANAFSRYATPRHEGMTHVASNIKPNSLQSLLTGYVRDVADRVANPENTLRGAVDRMKSQSPEEMALDWSNPVAGGLVGMFAGKGAKTANLKALLKVEEMKAAGVPDSQVWKETGWTLNTPDGKPRFEIDDSGSQIGVLSQLTKNRNTELAKRRDEIINRVKAEGRAPTNEEKFYVNNINNDMQTEAYRGDVRDVLAHDNLYSSYDGIGDSGLNWRTLQDGTKGEWDDARRTMNLSMGQFGDGAKSTTLHELQHAIQQREGFARGGSPEMFKVSNSEGMHSYEDILRAEKLLNMAKENGLKVADYATNPPRWLDEKTLAIAKNFEGKKPEDIKYIKDYAPRP